MKKLLGLAFCAGVCVILGFGTTGCTKKTDTKTPAGKTGGTDAGKGTTTGTDKAGDTTKSETTKTETTKSETTKKDDKIDPLPPITPPPPAKKEETKTETKTETKDVPPPPPAKKEETKTETKTETKKSEEKKTSALPVESRPLALNRDAVVSPARVAVRVGRDEIA